MRVTHGWPRREALPWAQFPRHRTLQTIGNMTPRRELQRTCVSESIARSEFSARLTMRCTPPPADIHGAEELLEWIEDCDVAARFVPIGAG